MAPKSAAEARQWVAEAEEEILCDRDDVDDIVKRMTEAADVLKEAKDHRGLAQALHMVIGSNIAKAERIRVKSGRGAAPLAPILEDMNSIANKNLEIFRGAGDKYGEAYMLLSVAEVSAFHKDDDKSREGLDAVVMGSKIANEQGEKHIEARCEYAIVMLHVLLKNVDAAVTSAEKGVKLFEEVGDKRAMVNLYSVLAPAYEIRERYQDMHATLRKGLAIAREVDDKRLIEKQCRAIADLHCRKGQLKEALPLAKEALAINESLAPKSGHGEVAARRCIMFIHSVKGDMTAALKLAAETVKLFEARGQKTELVMAYDGLCHMHARKTDGEEALRAADMALEIAREIGDKRWQSNILKTIADTYSNMNQFHEADEKMKETQEILQDMGEKEDEAHLIHERCVLHFNNADYESAHQIAQDALEHAQSTNNKRGEAFAHLDLALSTAATGDMDEAVKSGNEALDIFSELDDLRGQANLHQALTEIYVNSNEYDHAIENATLALEAFEKLGDVQAQADAQRLVTSVYMASEDLEGAVTAATAARQLTKKSDDKRKEIDMLLGLAHAQLKLIRAEAERSKNKRIRGASRAMKPAREARALAKKIGDKNILGNAMYVLAEVQAYVGRLDEALKSALATASLFRETSEPANEVIALVFCGEIMHAKGDMEKAKETVEQAYAIAEKAGDKYGQYLSANCLEEMAPETKAPTAAAAGPSAVFETSQGETPVQAKSAGLDPEFVKKFVHETVMAVVGGDEDSIMWDSPLMDSGMDSLSSVQFRNELQRQAGFNLPAAMIFDYPTQAQIVDHLVEQSQVMGK